MRSPPLSFFFFFLASSAILMTPAANVSAATATAPAKPMALALARMDFAALPATAMHRPAAAAMARARRTVRALATMAGVDFVVLAIKTRAHLGKVPAMTHLTALDVCASLGLLVLTAAARWPITATLETFSAT